MPQSPTTESGSRLPNLRTPTALIATATALAATVVVALSVQTIRSDTEVKALRNSVAELQGYVDGAREVAARVIDAEAARRGFLLSSNDPTLLAPYHAALQQIAAPLGTLREHATRHPAEADRIAEIDGAVATVMAEITESIRLAEMGRTDEAVQTMRTDAARANLSKLRAASAQFIEQHTAEIRALLAESEKQRRTRDAVVMALAAAGLVISAVGIVLLVRWYRLARRREREAAESSGRLRLLADTLPGLVSYLDTDVRYRFMNSRYRDWFGIDPKDFLGKTPEEVAGQDAGALFRGWVMQALRGEPLQVENIAPFARGGTRPVRCYLTPDRDANGQVRGVVSLTLDITREQETMRALEEARDQALEASRAKSRFVAAASHDMRQPLYALTLFASALERRLKQENAAELVRNIQQAARSLQSMFNSLLDVSKLDAGVTTPRISAFPVGDVLHRLEMEFRDRAVARGLRFRLVPSTATVQSDPELLESILRNLISNAVKFTASGSILIGCRRAGGRLRIEVHDTGPGIPPDQMDRLFKEFAHGNVRSSGGETGLGLGLAIVQRVAKMLDHELTASSPPGRGASFTIAVPLASQPEAEPQAESSAKAAPETTDLGNRHVLVVEDEPEVRSALARLLGEWGMRVSEAGDAESAEAAVTDRPPPDLVLVDYNLGKGPNGLDVVRRIEQRMGRRVAALVVTGATGPETLVTLKASGIPWATKPLDPPMLRARISAAMQRPAAE